MYFWSRRSKSSSAEVDYIISKGDKIIPIEVKSGPAGKLKSLQILMNSYPNIEKAFVLSTSQSIRTENDKINFMPLYMANALAEH